MLILEKTKGANVVDSKVIIPQFVFARDGFALSICEVVAGSGINSVKVHSFIIKDIEAKPYIAQNLRSEKDFKVSSTDNWIYLAVFELGSSTSLLSLDTSQVCQRHRLFYLHSYT